MLHCHPFTQIHITCFYRSLSPYSPPSATMGSSHAKILSLLHLRSAQNSGILWYLSVSHSEEIEILISLPPVERNLNRGIYHTLIFTPLRCHIFKLFIKVKADTQSSH